MASSLKELRGRLNERREKAAEILRQAGPDLDMDNVTSISGDSAAKVEAFRSLQAEINEIRGEMEPLEADERALSDLKAEVDTLDQLRPHPGHAVSRGGERDVARAASKSLGTLFAESDAIKGRRGRPVEVDLADVDFMATLFETSAGWAPPDVRGPRLVDFATRPVSVVDLFPQSTTTQASIIYMEETTFTNAAAEVAEGASKPEAALELTERNEPVRTIAVWLPVTNQQLDDVPQVRGYIDNRLGFMVRQRLDGQLLVGDGTAPNLSGILDRSGLQTEAKGADATPDAVYKAMTKVRVNAFAEPNAAVFHPNDWQDVRLLRTADGIYIWGNPADAGPERIWGLRVAQTTALTENTGLVGDFQQAELVVRQGVTFAVSDSHDTYFVENKQAIRAEMRAALAVYRPAAFCSVTGI